MNAAARSPSHKWRWGWAFLFLFLFHAGLVFWLGEHSEPSAVASKPAPLLLLPADDASMKRVADLAAGADPTLFALPHPRGFSGDAWLNFTPARIEVATWSNAPSALPLPVDDLGSALLLYANASRVPSDELLATLRNTTPFELSVPPRIMPTTSTYVVEAPLNLRLLPLTNSLPVATNLDVLAPTVLDLAVNGEGVVESVMLVAQSGLRTIDDRAIDIARSLAFQPLPRSRSAREVAAPQRGRVIFTWHVVPPALTNGLTASGL
jgi:hypothetical protein